MSNRIVIGVTSDEYSVWMRICSEQGLHYSKAAKEVLKRFFMEYSWKTNDGYIQGHADYIEQEQRQSSIRLLKKLIESQKELSRWEKEPEKSWQMLKELCDSNGVDFEKLKDE